MKNNTMDYIIVSFNELLLAEKRLLVRKLMVESAEYYRSFGNPTFKDFSENITFKLETLTEGLEQKISDEHNSFQIFDIALRYLLENVD